MNYIDLIALVNGMDPYRYWITFGVLVIAAVVVGSLWAIRPMWTRPSVPLAGASRSRRKPTLSMIVSEMQKVKQPWQFAGLLAWLMAKSLAPWAVVAYLGIRYGPWR